MSDDNSTDLAQWLALRRAGLGSSNFALLLGYFGTIAVAWDAPADELARAGLEAQFARAFQKARSTFDPSRELDLLAKHGARQGEVPPLTNTEPWMNPPAEMLPSPIKGE